MKNDVNILKPRSRLDYVVKFLLSVEKIFCCDLVYFRC